MTLHEQRNGAAGPSEPSAESSLIALIPVEQRWTRGCMPGSRSSLVGVVAVAREAGPRAKTSPYYPSSLA